MTNIVVQPEVIKALSDCVVDIITNKIDWNAIDWQAVAEKSCQRPTGEWIRFHHDNQPFHIKCSNCGQYWSIDTQAIIFKYCFNCGARMKGAKE